MNLKYSTDQTWGTDGEFKVHMYALMCNNVKRLVSKLKSRTALATCAVANSSPRCQNIIRPEVTCWSNLNLCFPSACIKAKTAFWKLSSPEGLLVNIHFHRLKMAFMCAWRAAADNSSAGIKVNCESCFLAFTDLFNMMNSVRSSSPRRAGCCRAAVTCSVIITSMRPAQ